MDLRFKRRNYSQFWQGNTVTVSAVPQGVVCPAQLLRERQKSVGLDPASYAFRGFNGRLVTKSVRKSRPTTRSRSGWASAAYNPEFALELWGRYGA